MTNTLTLALSQKEREKRCAQRACCTKVRSAQRFWVPLGTGILLRARPMRATRALHIRVRSEEFGVEG